MYWDQSKSKHRLPVLQAALFSVLCFLSGCSMPVSGNNAPHTQSVTALANPASQFCVKQGGTLTIQKRGDGGEYGVCVFEDNRQCEEWALLRGACPAGGRKITGYATPAAQYCVITGGRYQIDSSGDRLAQERGTCSLADKTCEVWAYYNGLCRLND